MKRILLFGAGKSATTLIRYLGGVCVDNGWQLRVYDSDQNLLREKTRGISSAVTIVADVLNDDTRTAAVKDSDVVISMLPPHLHLVVANECLSYSKNLLTASYVDEGIRQLEDEIQKKGLLFLCEIGLDPGIDHMSAMKIIDEIKASGGDIISFKSHCGGLVAPESDDNPWHYKISWNPRNIVMAGSQGAMYLENGKEIRIPYRDVFKKTHTVAVAGLPELSAYANRNCLAYRATYGLNNAQTFIRTTLRYPEFCSGWNELVRYGFTETEDHNVVMTAGNFRKWFDYKTKEAELDDFPPGFRAQVNYLGMLEEAQIPEGCNCSAEVLQYLLEKNLALRNIDRDMIVMQHEIEFDKNGQRMLRKSHLVVKGDDHLNTAMAKTVGLPLGVAAKLVLQGALTENGISIPVSKSFYQPILSELEKEGIKFIED